MMSTPHARLSQVTKSYTTMGQRHAVFRDLDLEFERGVNLGVIGPNGSGKSTLLRLIAGADVPDRGRVVRYSRLSWPIGFSGVFDPALSGIVNARFCARIYGRDPGEVTDFTSDFSGLGDFMKWPLQGYSAGMRARYAFGLSMAIDFDCMLIDEVLGVGDQDFRAKCAVALEQRRQTSDIILVSHNLKDIIRLCDRVLILGGRKPVISDDVAKTVKRYSYALTGANEEIDA
jgi:capsular polysaccharide transport system ATP-binding protein